MIHRETAEEYHARQAISAGFLWDMVKPDGCPSYAFARSAFNPKPLPQKKARELDVGTAAHLAVLEPELLEKRVSIIDADDYRSKDAQTERNLAIFNKRVPLLRADYQLVCDLSESIEQSDAAELLFGEGESEVSYTWDALALQWGAHGPATKIEGKARADRITPHAIVDLKTAASASPDAFQRAMARDGHHLRAAWYIDGWMESAEPGEVIYDYANVRDYLFVVVAKEPPHLVAVYRCDERALGWGRTLYKKALSLFREAQESGSWRGYGAGEKIQNINLPAYAENQLIYAERAGEFDADESEDIPY